MRSLSAFLRGNLFSLLLLFLLLLPSCKDSVLLSSTVDGLTYTCYGTNRIERIVVTKDGNQIGTYSQRGLPYDMVGDGYGILLTDVNFDGKTDILLQTAAKKAGAQYACYLWDSQKEMHVYHRALSSLAGLTIDSSLSALTAREYQYTVDPATADSPAFYTEKHTFVIYRWIDGTLTPVHRKELTYYEESDIYCYAILNNAGTNNLGEIEWDTERESWIVHERFDATKYPLDATGYAAK